MSNPSPLEAGYQLPAEWTPHDAVWLAWPSAADLWEDDLLAAQAEQAALCRAIGTPWGDVRPERIELLVPDALREAEARAALSGLDVRFHRVPFGDIWLRDTAPLFVRDREGRVAPVVLRFNGWGGKYVLEHDDTVAERIAALAELSDPSARVFRSDFVLEGGSVEVDGDGTCLTTRQCLLNTNRNLVDGAPLRERDAEDRLKHTLGVEKVLWVDEGLLNDHTDGHIDTIVRFLAPGVVCCMAPFGADDPNRAVLDRIAAQLESMTDARGRKLEVVRIPSPGLVVDAEGEIMPASHVNFYVGNTCVVVPTYGTASATHAVEAIARWVHRRSTIGSEARAILTGGGAFHCITQQVPRAGDR